QNEEKWDFVLVSDNHGMDRAKKFKRQKFLEELSKKGFAIKTIEEDTKLFYGVRAPQHIFWKYQCLLMNPDSRQRNSSGHLCVPMATRIRIVYSILENTDMSGSEKLHDLRKQKVFEAAFPLHEEEEITKILEKKWASWTVLFKEQPIEHVRNYFGEKVALYFAWLGCYTYLLIFAALAGLATIAAGATVFSSSQVSKEICDANNTIMCPLCDENCSFWVLSDTCTYAKVTHMIDNEATVVFAMFMAIWGTCPCLGAQHMWLGEGAEGAMEQMPWVAPHASRPSPQIMVLIGITHALVIYRAVAMALFMQSQVTLLSKHADTIAVVTGAVLHYITIVIMTKVNWHVALFLCRLENARTLSQWENNFTVKIFIFQFFTHFSSLIYVAFFLGRINGHPGHYVRIAGHWRLEEVVPRQPLPAASPQPCPHGSSVPPLQEHQTAELSPKVRWGAKGSRGTFPHGIIWMQTQALSCPPPVSPSLGWLTQFAQTGQKPLSPPFPRGFVKVGSESPRWVLLPQNRRVQSVLNPVLPHSCSTGYINNSLSVFHIQDFEHRTKVLPEFNGVQIKECRYRDYRNADDYTYTIQFWHIFAARLAFLIIFEHVALCVKLVAAWYIPDVPLKVKNHILKRKHSSLHEELSMTEYCTEV
ncbi:ANO9 protein, partial [Erythrocercus mccallii]|nr:ANO9 protein [Erythrocercus mccallii]